MKVHIEFDVQVPDLPGLEAGDSNDAIIEEWLRFSFHDNGVMSTKNPLCYVEPEPILGTFLWRRNETAGILHPKNR